MADYHKVRQDDYDFITTCKADGEDYVVYGGEPFCPACGKELDWGEQE